MKILDKAQSNSRPVSLIDIQHTIFDSALAGRNITLLLAFGKRYECSRMNTGLHVWMGGEGSSFKRTA